MRQRLIWPHEKRIGEALRQLRLDANLTQRQLAERLGCAHSRVVKVENGRQRIALDEFILWCEALKADAIVVLRSIVQAPAEDA
jgi:transcriptional regulator with XRE-family HTH domain